MLRKTWLPVFLSKDCRYTTTDAQKNWGTGEEVRFLCPFSPFWEEAGSLGGVIWLVAPLHVISALTLVFLVLLHSGKGGGLSDMFGGGLGAQAAGSTVVERNLDRITIVAALVFTFASVSYALII